MSEDVTGPRAQTAALWQRPAPYEIASWRIGETGREKRVGLEGPTARSGGESIRAAGQWLMEKAAWSGRRQ